MLVVAENCAPVDGTPFSEPEPEPVSGPRPERPSSRTSSKLLLMEVLQVPCNIWFQYRQVGGGLIAWAVHEGYRQVVQEPFRPDGSPVS